MDFVVPTALKMKTLGSSAKLNECIVFQGRGQREYGALLDGFIPLKGRWRGECLALEGERG